MRTKQNFLKQCSKVMLTICALSMVFYACKKADKDFTKTNQFTNTAEVMASIAGQVVDDAGVPVNGATVTTGTHTFVTGSDGVFFFRSISTKENATLVKVAKAGYFHGFRTMSITKNHDHNTRIRIMKMDNTKTFSAIADATITAGAASVSIPKNSVVVEASGVAYTGSVVINTKLIKALDANIAELTPGALRGIASSGEENALATYGMLAVEMTDASGNKLQLGAGKTAEIRMPIAAAQLATAPATIALWHFDEVKGMWVEEGSAIKVGAEYIGSVKHFSYWNCDYGGPICNFSATFLDSATNTPLSNMLVSITSSAATAGTRSSWTDATGLVAGGIPTNSSYTLNLIDQCGSVFYSTTFTSATSNVNLGNILVTLPTTSATTIIGTVVDCSSNLVPNALVLITNGYYTSLVTANASGAFTYTSNLCLSPTVFTFKAYDVLNLVNGTSTASISAGLNNVGALVACGTITEFLNYNLTDAVGTTNFSFVVPISNLGSYYQGSNTSINGSDSVGSTSRYSYITFNGAGTTGAHTITDFSQFDNTFTPAQISGTGLSIPINVTQYGATIGSFIGGNFNGTFVANANTYTLTGNFNVKRNF
jgi:hypothetical protein